MPNNSNQNRLKPLIERAVAEVCGFPRPGFWFCVDAVKINGRPLERVTVWATLHFTIEGTPSCCGEPGCHLWLFGERLIEVTEHLRRAPRLESAFSVDFRNRIGVNYHEGVTFRGGQAEN